MKTPQIIPPWKTGIYIGNGVVAEQEETEIQEQSRLDGIANLHEEQALKIHMEETNAIINERNQSKAVA
jgi:hypothetical protein